MYSQLRGKGVEIVTVNGNDTAPNVAKFWKSQGFSMRATLDSGSVMMRYVVETIPTNIVIGQDGRILGRFVGFDQDGIRAAFAKAGVR